MATNKEVIQYYGRSSQTVHRHSLMTTEVESEVSNRFHSFGNLEPPESHEKRRKQFYSLNIPSDGCHTFTPGVMVCSETVHRNGGFVPKVSAPASLRELPSPNSLLNKKRTSTKRRLENNGWPFSAAVSHLRDIKAKQAKFQWETQLEPKCINKRLNFDQSAQHVLINEPEDPVATASLMSLGDQVLENSNIQGEQITVLADSETPLEKEQAFTFRPMLTFNNNNKQQKIQSNPYKGLFYFAEE